MVVIKGRIMRPGGGLWQRERERVEGVEKYQEMSDRRENEGEMWMTDGGCDLCVLVCVYLVLVHARVLLYVESSKLHYEKIRTQTK